MGTGIFSLTGVSTYTGNTEVAGGTLFVDGSIASPLTTADPGTLLGGIGTIGGNVYNHGTVMGGDAPGTLTIGGNYVSASNGSNLLVEIENVKIFSRLTVDGSATITGTLTVDPYAGSTAASQLHKYRIVHTLEGTSGTFNNVVINTAIPQYDVIYYSDDIWLLLGMADFHDTPGLTPNQQHTGKLIDLLFNPPGGGKTNNDFVNVVFSITDVPGPQLAPTLDQISPIGLADMIEIPIGNDSMVYGNLTGRFDDIRSGVDDSASVSKVPLSTKDDDKKQIEPPVQEGETPNHWSAWSSGIGGFATDNTTPNQPGYSFTTSGMMIGADYRARRNLVFGIVGTYLNASSSSTDGANVDLNSGKLGAYGTWWDDSGNYVQGYAGGGFDSYDTQRSILLPGYVAGSIPGTTGTAGGPYRVARGDTIGTEANIRPRGRATIGSWAISWWGRRSGCSMITCRSKGMARPGRIH